MKINLLTAFIAGSKNRLTIASRLQLAKNQNEPEQELSLIKQNFIDVHARLKQGWILPLKNYSLKTVAKWLNFKWSKKEVDGATALLWWRQIESLKSNKKKEHQLKKILNYNKNDCIATWKIAEGIINQN